jgi:hypothetical protein
MKRQVGESLVLSAMLMVMIMAPGFIRDLEPLQQDCVLLIIDALLFLYIFYSVNSAGGFKKEVQEPNKRNLLILIPVFAVMGAMVLITIISGLVDTMNMLSGYLAYGTDFNLNTFLTILRIVLSVLIEEMIFRMSFFNRIRTQNRAVKILISAAIFTVFDILLVLQDGVTFQYILFSMIISFLLGVVLGAIMEYGHCVYFCMLVHFLFRFAYWDFQVVFAIYAWRSDIIFNPLLWLIICNIYLVVMYFVYFRKKEYGRYV